MYRSQWKYSQKCLGQLRVQPTPRGADGRVSPAPLESGGLEVISNPKTFTAKHPSAAHAPVRR